MTTDLRLERKEQEPGGIIADGAVMITPQLGGDYWSYRVLLSESQAIVGFPKFGTVGIGFAREDDWNTNLPYTCGTEEIYDHIAHNKDDDLITRERCIEAISLIQHAATADRAAG
ncbi:MAG: hypothetical protein ACLQFR_17320 [Streptosporangiaceae bacterium]